MNLYPIIDRLDVLEHRPDVGGRGDAEMAE